ncbi:rho GTPase-activating protein 20-like [Myripristis murdjan]|uniref:Rho GTPase-activating protein 20-like n=1 Tax=Myripristis murdjan TaxID=586833 RepID=A0A667X269_9TELE|nr:rho GTPase-activating protein 20-like [Myripristis murdjan]
MDSMSPQQQQDNFSRGGGQQENKRRIKSVSHRRQSAPSLVITKALTRSRTLSRESFLLPLCPETCPLVQSYLACPGRSFLLHAHAQLKTGLQTQDRHLFLFSDIMVIAKAKSANHFKLKAQACVCEMWTAGCMEEVCEGSTNPDRGFVMGWPTCNCVATFSSAEQKERWLSLLKSRIKEEKEREEPKTIPLKVYGKGINTYAVTKTLPVSNSDSTNEVIRLALQQFGIPGNVKDYQLWVISKRDNTPYPLIGHEFPFSIQMSHVRDVLSQAGSSWDTVSSPDRQRALQAEQLQADKRCQFILKPRPIATTQHVFAESSQKPFKRRRSLINWAFWRGSSSQLNELSMSLSQAAPGCLFGHPLSSVCVEDTLPKPVMDMLVFLYHEGSWTRGIFRRPAGTRAVRELRESLDAGLFQLPLTRDHVFIIAGVFKDFLRSIPGSLLCSEMYEEWMDVLEEEEEEEEEQVQDIKRLIGRLPKENALLLRYLIAMLHGIQGNAHDNLMTSLNLSVCIAHSMLWPPGPCSPEVEGAGAKKVCELVKFMIEHCQQIIGEDPSSLFGGPPQRLDTDEMASDSWHYSLTDSSYDSLENELDDHSSGTSPALHARKVCLKVKPLQGSLDSILTLSDCDQDTDPDTHHACGKPVKTNCVMLHPFGRTTGRTQGPNSSLACPKKEAPMVGSSSTLDSLALDGRRRQRRRSEPAIAYMTEFRACLSGSNDDLTDEEEDNDKELSKGPSGHTRTHTHSRAQNRRGGRESGFDLLGGRSLGLKTSTSSLSSDATSPVPTRTSLDSLDSLGDQTGQTRQGGFCSAKACLPTSSSSLAISPPSGSGPTSPPFTPSGLGSVLDPGGDPDQRSCPKDSTPKETLPWGTLKSSGGLHPNSWLKKARRLSLTQQDNLENEEDTTGGRSIDKSLCPGKLDPENGRPGEKGRGKQMFTEQTKAKPSTRPTKERGGGQVRARPGQEPAKSLFPKHDSSSIPAHHRSTGNLQYPKSPCLRPSDSSLQLTKASQQQADTGSDVTSQGQAAGSDVNEFKQPSEAVFHRQSGPMLSLFRRQKRHSGVAGLEEECKARLSQRRASEPGRLVMDRTSTLYLDGLYRQNVRRRLPSDPGLKVSEVDSQGGTSEPRFCLSPHATKAVREYFSSHPRSNPQSGQQVALALVESHREWLKRCHDPTAESDFDQLLFAEESYV